MTLFMSSALALQEMYVSLFTEHSRKQKINVIFTLQVLTTAYIYHILHTLILLFQELFPNSATLRTCIKNATYLITFPFFSDTQALCRFFRRIFDKKASDARNALLHANSLKKNFCGYLLINVHPHDKCDHLKVRNFIGPITSANQSSLENSSIAQETLFPVQQLFVYNLM